MNKRPQFPPPSIRTEDHPGYGPMRVDLPPDTESDDDATIERALAILALRLRAPGHAFTSPGDTHRYLHLKLADKEREHFGVLFLDNRHRLIEDEILFKGTIDGASVYPREVVKAALKYNAAAVVLTHNHPSGVPEPSAADERITKRLKEALALVDVRLLDHIIVGGTESVSLAERGVV